MKKYQRKQNEGGSLYSKSLLEFLSAEIQWRHQGITQNGDTSYSPFYLTQNCNVFSCVINAA